MAVDILIAAYEDLCDHIMLISSDTDLIPAIKKARSLGKTVEYVGFQHSVSYAMKAQCTSYRLLTKADIAAYIKK